MLVQGSDLSKTIEEMCNMGFSKEEVQAALRAAFNNPDRAVEYLLNVINFIIFSFIFINNFIIYNKINTKLIQN